MGAELSKEQIEKFESLVETVEKRLKRNDKDWQKLSDKLTPLLEKREELLTRGENVEKLQKVIDDHSKRLHEVCENFKTLTEAMKTLERGLQRTGPANTDRPKSPGRQYVESDTFKKIREQGLSGAHSTGWTSIRVGRRFEHRSSYNEANAGALVQDVQLDKLIESAKTMPIHRRLLNVLPLGEGDTVKYARELLELALVTEVKTTANAGANQIELEIVSGLSTEEGWDNVTINGEAHTITAIAENKDGSGTITIAGTLAAQALAGAEVSAPFVYFTGRGKVAPKSVDKWETVTASVKKLLTHIEAEHEILEDDDRVEDLINRRGLARYARLEQRHVFYGKGTQGVTGFFNDVDIPKVLWSAMDPGSNKLDAILKGVVTVLAADEMPTRGVINPQDIGDIVGSKEDGGQYLIWQVFLGGMPARLWAIQLEISNAVDAGDCIIGDFSMAATLFVREEVEVEIGQPDKFFLQDKKALKFRGRFALAIEKPKALCIIKFDSKPLAAAA